MSRGWPLYHSLYKPDTKPATIAGNVELEFPPVRVHHADI